MRTEVQAENVVNDVVKYLENEHLDDILRLLRAEDASRHHSVTLDAQLLIDALPSLTMMTLRQPTLFLPLFDEALRRTQTRCLEMRASACATTRTAALELKPLVHVRLTRLPPIAPFAKPGVSAIRSSDIGRLIELRCATVVRVSAPRVLELSKTFRCSSDRCGHTFVLHSDAAQGHIFELPKVCPSQQEGGTCRCSRFEEIPRANCAVAGASRKADGVDARDFQELKVQEHVEALSVGAVPRSLVLTLEDDLVDSCKPGDEVAVVGVLYHRWERVRPGSRCQLELRLAANSVRPLAAIGAAAPVTDGLRAEFESHFRAHRDAGVPLRARDAVVASVCPQIFGLFTVKLSILLMLLGGCGRSADGESDGQTLGELQRKHRNRSCSRWAAHCSGTSVSAASRSPAQQAGSGDGSSDSATGVATDVCGHRIRGDIHMLLVGDPGTGKSQFLRFTTKLAPRAVLTTGVGTTSAGLTCSAVKEHNGEWGLEAGALVLADRGVCCIDEFSSIQTADRATIHEAMEQQTLSVAKVGLVCKLNARATVFAVTNPKGKYDIHQCVSVNTAIASPLLSRFDIVLVLLDTPNPEWDQVVSSFILRQAMVPDGCEAGSYAQRDSRMREPTPDPLVPITANGTRALWSMAKLRTFIAWARSSLQPELGADAMQVLSEYYTLQRNATGRSAGRTTIRLLESLVRVSQAHARLMLRREVSVCDAITAVLLMESSMNTEALMGLDSALHSEFAAEPDLQYLEVEDRILRKLGLLHLRSSANVQGTSASQSADNMHNGSNSAGNSRDGWHKAVSGSHAAMHANAAVNPTVPQSWPVGASRYDLKRKFDHEHSDESDNTNDNCGRPYSCDLPTNLYDENDADSLAYYNPE